MDKLDDKPNDVAALPDITEDIRDLDRAVITELEKHEFGGGSDNLDPAALEALNHNGEPSTRSIDGLPDVSEAHRGLDPVVLAKLRPFEPQMNSESTNVPSSNRPWFDDCENSPAETPQQSTVPCTLLSADEIIVSAKAATSTAQAATVYQSSSKVQCPDELPVELVNLIFQNLTVPELWPLLGVCKNWRRLLRGNPLLWQTVDISMFKKPYRWIGAKSILEWSQGHVKSLAFSEPKGQTDLERLTSGSMRRGVEESLLAEFVRSCPNLRSLSIPRMHVWQGKNPISWPSRLTSLHLHVHGHRALQPLQSLKEILQANPHLENLVLSRYSWTKREIEWTVPGSLPSLKSFEIAFGFEARTPREVNSNSGKHRKGCLERLRLTSLAKAAPNLSKLKISRCEFLTKGNTPLSDPGFQLFSNLKECVISDICPHCLVQIPPLPAGLEKLVFRIACPTYRDFALRPIASPLPHLPKLKALDVNFDSICDWGPPEAFTLSTWASILASSQCKLESLTLRSGYTRGDGTYIYNPQEAPWISSLLLWIIARPASSELHKVSLEAHKQAQWQLFALTHSVTPPERGLPGFDPVAWSNSRIEGDDTSTQIWTRSIEEQESTPSDA